MADTKISALTALTTVDDNDVLAIVDDPAGTPITKKITKANLVTAIPAGNITSGTLTDARVAETNVTQHQAALSIATSQLTGTVGTAQVANDAVTYAKIQNVSATDKLLGRSTAGAGDIEEITCTAAGRAILDDADATAQRTTLGAQEILVSGTNIKTVNSTSLLGSGNISTGDVVGPSSATDNAITRFDSTTGKLIQDSRVTLSDNGDISTSTFSVAGDKYLQVQNPSAGTTSRESLILAEDSADATKLLQISHLNNSWTPSTAVDFANSGHIRAGGAGGLNLEATNGPVRIAANGTKYFDISTAGASEFYGSLKVPDDAYGAGWNGSREVPTKNALYDKIETLSGVTDGDKGDITVSGSGATWTIDNNIVSNAKLATVATATFKGRTSAGTGNLEDLTATQATALLNSLVGDSGSGGTKGLAPAPASGDAAAGKFLKADGTWAVPAGGGGGSPGGSTTQVQFNDAGAFAGDSQLTFDKTSGLLSVTGAGTSGVALLKTLPGSGTSYVQINDNGTAVINADVSTGANPLRILYNGTEQFAFDYQGTFSPRAGGKVNIGAGVMHLTDSSGVAVISTYNELQFKPGALGGTGTRTVSVIAQNAAQVPFLIKGAASQSASLTEWQNSAGTALLKITSAGNIDLISSTAIVRGALNFIRFVSGYPVFSEGQGNDVMSFGSVGAGTRFVNVIGDGLSLGPNYFTFDVCLVREAADILWMRRSTNAQTVKIANTYTSSTNNEFLFLGWSSNTGILRTVKGSGGGSARALELGTDGTTRLTIGSSGGITIADANNISFGTTTGTKIGTSTTEKLSFWNATPIVQPTTSSAAASFTMNSSGILNDTATFDGYTIGQVVKALRDIGVLA